VIEAVTSPKYWDYSDFEKATCVLTTFGPGVFVPAYNRPESIHLQGMRRTIDALDAKTDHTGKEHARSVLADVESRSLVYGRTTTGSAFRTRIDTARQPGREQYQRLVGSIHTHPLTIGEAGLESVSHGFSNKDFTTFLTDLDQQFMIIRFGRNTLIMLKTSATPNSLSEESVEAHVQSLTDEFISGNHPSTVLAQAITFNKAVCTEFGLTLYLATEKSKDLAQRIEVTNF